ncbi:MAG TPA: glycoside hydrolase family 172 protein [Steroidobacter sp.]|nr:glycoside hydrolase family 172 protein [Steroidobacter sp.]
MSELFEMPSGVTSRSITFENPTGAPGRGGSASSPLGAGRKGAPARMIPPGATVDIADIAGPGIIRHIWVATYNVADVLRGLTVRAYWEGQAHPSIEAPLGDFFGFAHGQSTAYASAIHSVGEKGAFNIWLPMPFLSRARITITNELQIPALFFYQIDYTLGDSLKPDVGRLHVLFRRENPTSLARDFELLPTRRGKGRFLGAVIGVRPQEPSWWGEGEAKFYLDGDEKLPTIVGTGAEDYVGLGWCVQRTPYLYHGASLVSKGPAANMAGPVSMYRWHLADPIYWHESIRVTIQQIGVVITPQTAPRSFEGYLDCLRERQDDWSCCTFWYQPTPAEPLPPYPELAVRLQDLELEPNLLGLPLQAQFTTEDTL